MRFSAVKGKLLKAAVAYSSSGESRGYTPDVEFEYEVDGRSYRSSQLTALSARVLSNDKEAVAKKLQALEPLPTVFYDPKAPWDGFLQHGPLWGVWMPMLMGALFLGYALLILRKTGVW